MFKVGDNVIVDFVTNPLTWGYKYDEMVEFNGKGGMIIKRGRISVLHGNLWWVRVPELISDGANRRAVRARLDREGLTINDFCIVEKYLKEDNIEEKMKEFLNSIGSSYFLD